MSLEYGYLIINESFIETCLCFSFPTFDMQESEMIGFGNEPSSLTDTILTESVSLVAETGMMAMPPAIAIHINWGNTSAETKCGNTMLLSLRMIIVVKNPIILNILPKYILESYFLNKSNEF